MNTTKIFNDKNIARYMIIDRKFNPVLGDFYIPSKNAIYKNITLIQFINISDTLINKLSSKL